MLSQERRCNPAKIIATMGICMLFCGVIIQSAPPAGRQFSEAGRESTAAPQAASHESSVIDGGIVVYDVSDVTDEEMPKNYSNALTRVHGQSVMDHSGLADFRYATDTLRVDITQRSVSHSVYFTIEIWLSDASQLQSAFSSDRFDGPQEIVEDIAKRQDAVVAVNGDYAAFNSGGIVIRNGELYRANRSTRQMLVIDANGDFHAMQTPPENAQESAEAMIAVNTRHTLVFGPVLVEKGELVELPKKFFISTGSTAEPRTAVGQLGHLHYLWIVVDGRQDGYSRGISLGTLQELFVEHGALIAFNLDGGGSTTLFFNGHIINEPSNGGQRRVADILMIGD